jgi:putative transposase
MGSCFGTLKRELEMTQYNSHREAHAEIAQYIRYYNFERKHSGNKYLKPAQSEALFNQPE